MTLAQSTPLSSASTYPSLEISTYMEHQGTYFDQMKEILLKQYENQYIWLEEGTIKDFDVSHEALVLRIYGEGEPRSLFIKKVVAIEPSLIARSPKQWAV
jgi:hypothetical protein